MYFFYSLALVDGDGILRYVIFKQILVVNVLVIRHDRGMPMDLGYDELLIQELGCCWQQVTTAGTWTIVVQVVWCCMASLGNKLK